MSNKIAVQVPFVLILLLAGACRGKHQRAAVQNEEPEGGPRLSSSVKMGDTAAPAQLIRGFYGLEGGSWRWTAGSFAVVLRPPLGSAQRGGTLTLKFSIPDIVIEKLHAVALTASIGDKKLNTQTYSKTGGAEFVADVPADLLAKDSITVEFTLDKNIPPGPVEHRELGVVATGVSLQSK